MYQGLIVAGIFLAMMVRKPLSEISDDIIGITTELWLDVYCKGKEYLHERKKTHPLRSVQGEWSTSTSAAARRAQRRRQPLP